MYAAAAIQLDKCPSQPTSRQGEHPHKPDGSGYLREPRRLKGDKCADLTPYGKASRVMSERICSFALWSDRRTKACPVKIALLPIQGIGLVSRVRPSRVYENDSANDGSL